MGGSPGLVVYNDADDQWIFKSSYLPESDYDVLRRLDLSAIDMSAYVKATNTDPLTLTVPYDYGLTIQTPNGTPLIKTIDLNRTAIYGLSTGTIEVGNNVVNYPEAGVEPTSLSAWNWIKTRNTGLGTILQNQRDAILGEVIEDYVSYNWLI